MKPWCFFNRHRNPGKQRLLINQHKITWLACDKSLFVVKEKKQGNQWCLFLYVNKSLRRSRSKVFLGKAVLKICSKFTGEHPCRSAICCIFSEQLFLGTPLGDCFWSFYVMRSKNKIKQELPAGNNKL